MNKKNRKIQNICLLTNITIKTFARRIVGQIKEQMKLDNEQCELLLNAIFRK